MANGLVFGEYDEEAMERDAKAVNKSVFLKLKEGKNRLRVLPPKFIPGIKQSPFYVTWQHRIEVTGRQYGESVLCLAMQKKNCPVCLRATQLLRNATDVDTKTAKGIEARLNVYANVIDRSEPERGPLVYQFGKGVWGKLEAFNAGDMQVKHWHPVSGADLIITREGSGLNTRYPNAMPMRQNTPLADNDAQAQEWINTQTDLSSLVLPRSYDELAGLAGYFPELTAVPKQVTSFGSGRTAQDDIIDSEAEAE